MTKRRDSRRSKRDIAKGGGGRFVSDIPLYSKGKGSDRKDVISTDDGILSLASAILGVGKPTLAAKAGMVSFETPPSSGFMAGSGFPARGKPQPARRKGKTTEALSSVKSVYDNVFGVWGFFAQAALWHRLMEMDGFVREDDGLPIRAIVNQIGGDDGRERWGFRLMDMVGEERWKVFETFLTIKAWIEQTLANGEQWRFLHNDIGTDGDAWSLPVFGYKSRVHGVEVVTPLGNQATPQTDDQPDAPSLNMVISSMSMIDNFQLSLDSIDGANLDRLFHGIEPIHSAEASATAWQRLIETAEGFPAKVINAALVMERLALVSTPPRVAKQAGNVLSDYRNPKRKMDRNPVGKGGLSRRQLRHLWLVHNGRDGLSNQEAVRVPRQPKLGEVGWKPPYILHRDSLVDLREPWEVIPEPKRKATSESHRATLTTVACPTHDVCLADAELQIAQDSRGRIAQAKAMLEHRSTVRRMRQEYLDQGDTIANIMAEAPSGK